MRQEDGKMTELERLYMELGKAYYEGAFEDPLPQLLPLFDKISEIVLNGGGESQEDGTVSETEFVGETQLDSEPLFENEEEWVTEPDDLIDTNNEDEEGPETEPYFETEPEDVAQAGCCPVCGAPIFENAKFCGTCGANLTELSNLTEQPAQSEPVPQGNICPNCGTVLSEGAKFCGTCGTKL